MPLISWHLAHEQRSRTMRTCNPSSVLGSSPVLLASICIDVCMIETLLVAVQHLTAADLARVATTCIELREAVKSTVVIRLADASRGLETIPICVRGSQHGCVSGKTSYFRKWLS